VSVTTGMTNEWRAVPVRPVPCFDLPRGVADLRHPIIAVPGNDYQADVVLLGARLQR